MLINFTSLNFVDAGTTPCSFQCLIGPGINIPPYVFSQEVMLGMQVNSSLIRNQNTWYEFTCHFANKLYVPSSLYLLEEDLCYVLRQLHQGIDSSAGVFLQLSIATSSRYGCFYVPQHFFKNTIYDSDKVVDVFCNLQSRGTPLAVLPFQESCL